MGKLQRFFGLEKRAALPTMPTSGGIFASSNILNWIFGTANSSGQTVNQITSLKLSSFYASVRNISEDIAKLPFNVYMLDANFNKKLISHPASYLLNKQPSSVSIPFTFKQTLLEFALIQGNGYAYIERDKDAKPIALYVLDSRYVTPQIYNQKLYYIIQDINSGVKGTFTQDEIFHIKGMGDGYVGQSIVGYAAESIGKALATQSYASGFFGNGATLTGTIEVPGVVENEATANNIKTRFIDSIKGNGTASGVGLLANGAKFTKISVSPNEAQFIESQEFNVADIARWFRMPLSKIQSGSTGSSNLEQLNIEYVTDCLMPWLVRFEQEVERKLFRTDEMDKLDAKFDVSKLLRGDMAATATYLKDLYYIGAINVNDARRFLDMNNVGADGDIYFSPLNMIPTNMATDYWTKQDAAKNQTSLKQANPQGN